METIARSRQSSIWEGRSIPQSCTPRDSARMGAGGVMTRTWRPSTWKSSSISPSTTLHTCTEISCTPASRIGTSTPTASASEPRVRNTRAARCRPSGQMSRTTSATSRGASCHTRLSATNTCITPSSTVPGTSTPHSTSEFFCARRGRVPAGAARGRHVTLFSAWKSASQMSPCASAEQIDTSSECSPASLNGTAMPMVKEPSRGTSLRTVAHRPLVRSRTINATLGGPHSSPSLSTAAITRRMPSPSSTTSGTSRPMRLNPPCTIVPAAAGGLHVTLLSMCKSVSQMFPCASAEQIDTSSSCCPASLNGTSMPMVKGLSRGTSLSTVAQRPLVRSRMTNATLGRANSSRSLSTAAITRRTPSLSSTTSGTSMV
mmetsp:Transcript_2593/g.6196  ORF Transcript_2593/g.6196 Transcript_2593/m.6196 type:complete len:374 (+) Transcript_2593:1172-2293(+)